MKTIGIQLLLCIAALSATSCGLGQQAANSAADSQPQPFSATVDRQPIELHPFPGGQFGIFEVCKPAEVMIHAGRSISGVVVRPLSANVNASILPNHQDFHITARDSTPLTIEVNGDITNVIHFFPYACGEERPSSLSVKYFGPGVTNAGVIQLSSGDIVYLAPGAWVKGVIRARYAYNISILGAGVLDATNFDDPHAGPYGGDYAIYLQNCPHARIHGITVFNSHNWTMHLRQSDYAQIDHFNVLNPGAWNGDDGIDLVSSSHAVVSHVFLRTNDDGIAVKNTANMDTSDIQVSNAVIWNMARGGNGLELGYETGTQSIHDIRFSDIDLIHVEHGAAISIHNSASSTVQNITYTNVRVESVRNRLLDFAIFYSAYSPDRLRDIAPNAGRPTGGLWDGMQAYPPSNQEEVSQGRGHINHVTVQNLQVLAGPLPPSFIEGFDTAHQVDSVHISKLSIQGQLLHTPSEAKISLKFAPNFVIQ